VEHRRLRQLQSRQQIPRRVWVVLVVGGLLTLANSSAARIPTFRHHAGHTVLLAAMICLVLLAIADVNNPFRGANRVPPDGFRLALETLDRLRSAK